MADGIASFEPFEIHQALHGYSDGHRLLACSTSLKPKDAKTLLVLSDASGLGASIGDEGYLTGYPLLESGVYALARTWAAPEVSRPGCVWTHTLLINFDNLAILPTTQSLIRAFRYPSQPIPVQDVYGAPIIVAPAVEPPSVLDMRRVREMIGRLLLALYDSPRDRIISSEIELSSREAVLFAIWNQQWPRLRRSFRFCTLAFGDRSGEITPFDLQMLPTRTIRTRFDRVIDADRPKTETPDWLEDALRDISGENGGALRAFLRETGGDVAGGREAFAPLCRLYRWSLSFGEQPDAIDSALTLINQAFAHTPARATRGRVLGAAAEHASLLSGSTLAFLIQHLDSLQTTDFDRLADKIGLALWERDPKEMSRLAGSDGLPRILAESTLAKLSVLELVDGIKQEPAVTQVVLEHRPEVLMEPHFWMLDGARIDLGLDFAARDKTFIDQVLSAMVSAKKADLAERALRAFGSERTLKAFLEHVERNPEMPLQEADQAWLAATVRDSWAVARALSHSGAHRWTTLFAVAGATSPDFVPNDYGDDPWWLSTRTAFGNLSKEERIYLSTYLLARALGYRSRSQAELMAFSLDVVYTAASDSSMPEEAWRLLNSRLPSSFWLSEWDRCRKLREGIVGAFVDRDLHPLVFGHITGDDQLFSDLADVAAKSWRGRDFLRQVKKALGGEAHPISRRINIIKQAL